MGSCSALVVRIRVVLMICVGIALDVSGTYAANPASRPRLADGSTVGVVDARGYDVDGVLHRLGERDGTNAIVVVFLSTECPISNSYVPLLNQMTLNGRPKGLEVYGVVCSTTVSRAKAVKFRDEFQVKFPLLFDASCELRRRFAPTHTPQAFVTDRGGKVMYRGALDNRYAAVGRKKLQATEHYLLESVAAVQSGRIVPAPFVAPIGCLMEDLPEPGKKGDVSWSRDIAPILFSHCVKCHRPGQTAPFSLLTFDDAFRHGRQIAEVTRERLMPPWKAVHGFGRFKEERRLSDEEIQRIEQWVRDGKPEGDPADVPVIPSFSTNWVLGKPDVILKMPQAYTLPASGEDVHRHFVLPIRNSETRLISAVEFRPGNAGVVHHACFYLDRAGIGRKFDQADTAPGYGGGTGAGFLPQSTLRSWLPGLTPRRLPDGAGRIVGKGSDLILELHYVCSGKVESDQSTVAIYFSPRKSKQIVGELQVLNYQLEIPAGAVAHRHQATYTLPEETVLVDCAPHMHLLGKEMKSVATKPDGQVVPLVWIKDWNFQWQEQYEFIEPIRLPKGTRIDVECVFDNSTGNRLNPHTPPQVVRWGEQTKEEMGICHFQFSCDRIEQFMAVNQHHSEHRNLNARAAFSSRQLAGQENAVTTNDVLSAFGLGGPSVPVRKP